MNRFQLVKKIVKEERGDLKTFITVIGLALVSAAAIGAALIYAPDTVETIWNDAISSIRGSLNL
ncbi:MAG: hypothetical protein FH756_00305 [Firmicutes bacterium]|nr:hypothetical protein [Bacillota bacterium]